MKLTERDFRMVRDICLSHVVSRDQLIALGYFGSITRANTRLRTLCEGGLLKRLTTEFHAQNLYMAGPRAKDIVGDRIAALLSGRRPSPQFVQHALAVTDVRTRLMANYSAWRFEPQVRQAFTWRGRQFEVRPDGVAIGSCEHLLVEVDLGHVSGARFKEKAIAYAAYLQSNAFEGVYGKSPLSVLTVTTSLVRRANLLAAAAALGSHFKCMTFEELGVRTPGGWS
jgi:hypothetical protein